MSRCYNKSDISYKNYGAKGITVCDEWKNNINQFIFDFKNLPGYEQWVNVPNDEKYLWHLDKDILQANKPINERQYCKSGCCIVHSNFNSRIKAKQLSNDTIGITCSNKSNTFKAIISSNRVKYHLGIFYSKIAAISFYNICAKLLPNTLINDLHDEKEMDINECLQYITPNCKLILPEGLQLPEWFLKSKQDISYGGSAFHNVRRSISGTYLAFNTITSADSILDEYTSEYAAANRVNNFFKDHNLSYPTPLSHDQIMDEKSILQYRVPNYADRRKNKKMETMLNRFQRFQNQGWIENGNGTYYKVIEIACNLNDYIDKEDFLVKIQFKETNTKIILSTSTIEMAQRCHKPILDYMRPTVLGVACLGMNNVPKQYKRLYTLWFFMIFKFYNKTDFRYKRIKIDPDWLNFATFLKDAKTLPGYDEFEKSNFDNKYTLENISLQQGIPDEEKIWSKHTSTFMLKSLVRSLSKMDRPKNRDLPMGVYHSHSTYQAKIMFNNTLTIIGHFDDPNMAGYAYDYYRHFLTGAPQLYDVDPREWQAHKSRMKPLYHLVQRQLYTLTGEDESVRRERCLRKYGIEI